MARAKYKTGTLVQIDSGSGTEYGIVTGVMTRDSGYHYEVDSQNGMTAEADITNGYRPIAVRKATAAKKPAKKASTAKKPAQESAPHQ